MYLVATGIGNIKDGKRTTLPESSFYPNSSTKRPIKIQFLQKQMATFALQQFCPLYRLSKLYLKIFQYLFSHIPLVIPANWSIDWTTFCILKLQFSAHFINIIYALSFYMQINVFTIKVEIVAPNCKMRSNYDP